MWFASKVLLSRSLCTLGPASFSSKMWKSSQSAINCHQIHSKALRLRGRAQTKKRLTPGKDAWSVVGYSTANSYDLNELRHRILSNGIYEFVDLDEELTPSCLCVTAKYKVEEEEELSNLTRSIYFFGDGSVVFWNVPELERDSVLSFLRKAKIIENEPYEEESIYQESEMLHFSVLTDPNAKSHLDSQGKVQLLTRHGYFPHSWSSEQTKVLNLEKYAFSNAIGTSVKLGMLEDCLDKLIDSLEFLSEDLKLGKPIRMSRREVLKKMGEIFTLRHVLNLSSDLLDTPDFYWDRDNLETLYHTTCAHFTIAKRTRVMNEKLNHCCELMDLVATHLNDEHHIKLEWYIIALIMIEVVFELLHFCERLL